MFLKKKKKKKTYMRVWKKKKIKKLANIGKNIGIMGL
jgi:hypothetical protein